MINLRGTGMGILATTSLLVSSLFTVYFVQQARAVDSNNGTCSFGLYSNVSNNMTLPEVAPLFVGVASSPSNTNVNRVVVYANNQIIGEARKTNTFDTVWYMPWVTRYSTAGDKQLYAKIYYNQDQMCQTQSINVKVANNPGVSKFEIKTNPSVWAGVTNTSFDISSSIESEPGTTVDIAKYAYYEWTTNIGSIAPNRTSARFTSGGSGANGRVLVKVLYGGKETLRELPIKVKSQVVETPKETPVTTPTTKPTEKPATEEPKVETPKVALNSEQKAEVAVSQIESLPDVQACTLNNLNPERIEELKALRRRLTAQEFAIVRGCFAQTNFTVPAVYAPVEPELVKKEDVPISSETRVNTAQTQVKTDTTTNEQKVSLRFEGNAKPGSDVLVYVFSEPLVLYAKADDKGNWVYDLVDPLEPGNHEAYAVVEDVDGTYKKSNPFAFLIETASATAENPNGYSLSVQTVGSLAPPAAKRSTNLYVVGASVLVGLVLGAGSFLLVRTLRHIPKDTPKKET